MVYRSSSGSSGTRLSLGSRCEVSIANRAVSLVESDVAFSISAM